MSRVSTPYRARAKYLERTGDDVLYLKLSRYSNDIRLAFFVRYLFPSPSGVSFSCEGKWLNKEMD